MHLAAMGYTMEQIKEVLNQSTTRVTQHYVTLQDDRYRDVYSRTKPVPSKKGTAEND
jgi:site-specific recombinase XerD